MAKKDTKILSKGEQRRKRRAKARRAEILAGAAAVFKEKGYVNATTKEIAHRADVAEGTIYIYFSSKQELAIALLEEMMAETVAALANIPVGDTSRVGEDLVQFFIINFQMIKEKRFFSLFFNQTQIGPEIFDVFFGKTIGPMVDESQKQIAKWIEIGIGRPIDDRIAAQMMNAMIIGFDVILNLKLDPYLESLAPEDMGKSVADILLNGLTKIGNISGNNIKE